MSIFVQLVISAFRSRSPNQSCKYEPTIVGTLLLCALKESDTNMWTNRLIYYPVVEGNRSTRRKTTENGFEVDTSAQSKGFESDRDRT